MIRLLHLLQIGGSIPLAICTVGVVGGGWSVLGFCHCMVCLLSSKWLNRLLTLLGTDLDFSCVEKSLILG